MNYDDAERRFFGPDYEDPQVKPTPPQTKLGGKPRFNQPTTPTTVPYSLRSFEVDDFVTFGRDELPADLDRIRRDLHIV